MALRTKRRPKSTSSRSRARTSSPSVSNFLQQAAQADPEVAAAFDADVLRLGNTNPTLSGMVDFTSTRGAVSGVLQSQGIDAAIASIKVDPVIQQLVDVSAKAVRLTLQHAIEHGWTPDETTRRLKPAIGLDARSVQALKNYETTLQGRTPPLTKRQIKTQVDAYKDRLRTLRTRTVARTQVTSALNQGRYQEWTQQAHAGVLPPGSMVEWVTTPDDKLCEQCAPLSGLRVPFGSQFSSTVGQVLHPPLHPNCRCTVLLITP